MIIIPLLLSYMYFSLINPIVIYLDSRFSLSKKAYHGIIFLIMIFFLLLFSKYFFRSFNQFLSELDVYYNQFRDLATNATVFLQREIPDLKLKEILEKELSTPIAKFIGLFTTSLKDFTQVTILSFICSIFFVFDPFTLDELSKKDEVRNFEQRLRRYVLIKTLTSLLTSVVITAYLYFIGSKFLFFVGFATFVLNFIPSFGSVLATILLIPIFGIEAESFSDVLLPLIFPGLVQFVVGNIIEPKFMGDSLKLGPIIIIFSLIFWGIIFGAYGLFLAVPLSLLVDALLRKMDFRKILYTSK